VKTLWQTPLVVIAAAIALVAGCSQQNVYQPPPPPAVTVSRPLQQDVTINLDETGTTQPFQYVDIRARVKGFLISEPELLAILERELMTFLSGRGASGEDSDAALMAMLKQRSDSGGGDEASDSELHDLLEKRAAASDDIATGDGPDVTEIWLLETLKEKAARAAARAEDPEYPKDEVSQEYLQENYFLPSANVKADEQLYQIDPQPYLATLRQSIAALNVANAEYIDADAKYQRGIPLVKDGAMSREEFGERAAVRGVKRANIKAAEAAVHAAKLDLDYTRVVSPIDGRVSKTLVYKGNLVGATDPTLLTNVVRYDPIYATFNISENELLRIQAAKEKAEASGETADDDKQSKQPRKVFMKRANDTSYRFPGQLDFTALTVDERTGTFQVRGVFDNPDNIIVPGLFVRIRVPLGTVKDALLVPQRAVAQDQQGKYLLVVDKDNKVERRDVALGTTVRDFVVVTQGLQADETVIIDGIQRARPGAKVTPEPLTLDPPAPEVIEPESDAAADAPPPTPEAAGEPSASPAAGTPPASPGGAADEPPAGGPDETPGRAPAETPGGTLPESPSGAPPAAAGGTTPPS